MTVDLLPATTRQHWHYDSVDDDGLSGLIAAFAVRIRHCDLTALQAAVDDLVERHEALRTVLVRRDHDDGVLQAVKAAHSLPIQQVDPGGALDDHWSSHFIDAAREPFEVRGGPLVRARLLRVGATDRVLLLAMHHAVVDGTSLAIIHRDLRELYEARRAGRSPRLPGLDLQFGDYAAWEQRAAQTPPEPWWQERLATGNPTLRRWGATGESAGAFRAIALPVVPAETMTRLRAVAVAHRTTEAQVVAAATVAALNAARHRELTFGLWVAHRDHPEVQNVVGDLADLLPVRIDLSGEPDTGELIRRVRTGVSEVLERPVPFAALRPLLRANPERRGAPLLDVTINYLDVRRPRRPSEDRTDVGAPPAFEALDLPPYSAYTVRHWWAAYGCLDVQHLARDDGSLGGQILADTSTTHPDEVAQLSQRITAALHRIATDAAAATTDR